MSWHEPNARERMEIMKNSTNVAIVGASDNPSRASYFVATYLMSASHFKLFFVNPRLETLFGQQVYKSLADIPEQIDIVDVFRKSSELEPVFESAQRIGAKNIWLQLGIENDELGSAAQSHGLGVVMNRCLKIDYDFFKTFS